MFEYFWGDNIKIISKNERWVFIIMFVVLVDFGFYFVYFGCHSMFSVFYFWGFSKLLLLMVEHLSNYGANSVRRTINSFVVVLVFQLVVRNVFFNTLDA